MTKGDLDKYNIGMNIESTCAIFGHRNIQDTEHIYNTLKYKIEKLIVYNGVSNFLFGSRSKFYDICHKVLSDLKLKYSHIHMIAYTCKHEYACTNKERAYIEHQLKTIAHIDTNVLTYDSIVDCSKLINTGKNSYIYRNNIMINNAKYCIFYHTHDYAFSNNRCTHSGTKLALDYATKKNRTIIQIKKDYYG